MGIDGQPIPTAGQLTAWAICAESLASLDGELQVELVSITTPTPHDYDGSFPLTADAQCRPGRLALSGGFEVLSGALARPLESRAALRGDGWLVVGFGEVTSYALCALEPR